MVDLVVLIPSRGRPDTAVPIVDSFAETCVTTDTLLVFVVDESDPTLPAYAEALDVEPVDAQAATAGDWARLTERRVGVLRTPGTNLIESLNIAATKVAGDMRPFAVAFLGDDNRPRTRGWDARFVQELRDLGTGLVFGDDQIQGENLPTQVAMTADVIRAIGYMGPPNLTHLYIDNFWLDLGRNAGCIRYLPDVVIEHLHPIAGKGEVDEGYRRVNAPGAYQFGQDAYAAYVAESLERDVATVKALRAGVSAS